MSRWRLIVAVIALACGITAQGAAESRRGELRGAWMGEGYGRDWPAIMKSLADNGFNAYFPNFSVGNMALYPSEVLAVVPGAEPGRDELAEAAKAARAHGIELHVWRINWALWRTPPELLDQLDAAGRLQRNSSGERGRDDPYVKVDWLCPSHPQNRELEKDSMLELVRRYDVAGIHFDYMRFPGGAYCFCDRCREQFQEDSEIAVERWPEDVLEDGPHVQQWRAWRRELQTSLVAEISDAARSMKPGIFVSLAAWPDLHDAYEAVGQEWPLWVRDGALDFVCPMDYTVNREEVSQRVRAQLRETRGAVPLYAGLGAFMMDSADTLIEQVDAAREAGADGFVAFAYGSGDLAEWLPHLRATVTAADPAPMPHRSPPARFDFGGAAVAPPAGQEKVIAGEQLDVGLAVGQAASPRPGTEAGEGAAQAAGLLRRTTEARSPVTTYGETPELIPAFGEERRISGRIVVETPSGLTLLPLGTFGSDSRVERTVRFLAPEGAFRIAIYGETQVGGGAPQGFVVRAALLTGVPKEELEAMATHEELTRFCAQAGRSMEISGLAHLDIAVQVNATGPGGGQWWLRLSDGKSESGEGSVENADLTVTLSAKDLLSVARGELSPRQAWDRGLVRASGDQYLLGELGDALGF